MCDEIKKHFSKRSIVHIINIYAKNGTERDIGENVFNIDRLAAVCANDLYTPDRLIRGGFETLLSQMGMIENKILISQ